MVDPRGDEALAELLRTAAPTGVPPAGFDHGTVLAAAHRARARRRRLLAGGAAAVVVVLAGGGAVAVLGGGAGGQGTAASAAAGRADAPTGTGTGRAGSGGVAPQVRPPDQLPEDPAPSRTAPAAGPQLLGAGTCGPADRAVYAALVRVFPELAAQPPHPVDRTCSEGTTGAGVLLSADGVVGRLEVFLGPAAATPVEVTAPEAVGTATTTDGRTVTVVSVPAAGAPAGPHAGTLGDLAQRLAVALG